MIFAADGERRRDQTPLRSCILYPFRWKLHMLYTHTGATLHTRDELARFLPPTLDELRAKRGEEAGARWRPVPFVEMATSISEGVKRAGLDIRQERYAVAKNGHDLFACFDFNNPIPGRDGTMGSVLGWRYSNMQNFALKGVSGARVFICDNGAIVGDFVFGHKMTTGFDREVGIDEGMQKWHRQIALVHEVYAEMERVNLTPEHVDHVLMESVRARIIAPSQLAKIDHEFASDRSVGMFGAAPTVRRLYEAVTEVAKTWSSPRVVERGARGFPDMALRLYGRSDLAAKLTEGDLGEPSAN